MAPPLFGGADIFGVAVHIQHLPNANAHQIDAFFGVSGNLTLFGGGRGRVFAIEGCLFYPYSGSDDATIAGLNAAEGQFMSFADGIARDLFDTRGRLWFNVIFKGEFAPSPEGPKWSDLGIFLQYKAIFHGLS